MDNQRKFRERSGRPYMEVIHNNSRLIGWLVSYAEEDMGQSYELRAGRYFISGDGQQEARTIVVKDEAISSPHIALNAGSQHTLQVMDIFSDHGTVVVRSGTNQEVPVTGPVQIEHGDWIRIANKKRFQVCLIDGPGR